MNNIIKIPLEEQIENMANNEIKYINLNDTNNNYELSYELE